MRKFNETFVLPNPPSWHDTAIKSIIKAIARLQGAIMPSSQGLVRVSPKSQYRVT